MTARGFVAIRRDAIAAYSEERALAPAERRVLDHLLRDADWRTGDVEGFNLTRCSKELGHRGPSGRRTLGKYIRRLADAGVVTYTAARSGTALGHLHVVDFDQLVHVSSARQRAIGQKTARENRALPAPPSARKTRAASPELPLLPGLSSQEEVEPEEEKLASEPGGSADWNPEELEELLAPLLEVCRRHDLPGMTNRAGTLRALRTGGYRRAQIEHAVRLIVQEVRVAGGLAKPVGVFTKAAKNRDPEYFTVPDPAPVVGFANPQPQPEGDAAVERIDPSEYLAEARQMLVPRAPVDS